MAGIAAVTAAVVYGIRLYIKRKVGTELDIVYLEEGMQGDTRAQSPPMIVRRTNVVLKKSTPFTKEEAAVAKATTQAWLSFSERRRERQNHLNGFSASVVAEEASEPVNEAQEI